MLKEGDIFEIKEGHRFYVKHFPRAFLCDNGDFDFRLTSGEIEVGGLRRGLDTSIFCGKYVVTKVGHEGGGSQLGMNGQSESWPDGHHVYAKKIVHKFMAKKESVSDFEINFYQSGSFTCMNPDIKPIGKASVKYEIASCEE